MISLMIFSIIATGLAGLILKFVFDLTKNHNNITWKEYLIGILVISIALVPSVTAIGWKIAKSNNLSFNEYWNGWEKEAVWTVIPCSRDGPCRNTYSCDPYVVMVPYTVCDSKNNCTTQYRAETRYHNCPYANEEWTFGVDTTLGFYSIDSYRFPENPQAHRWRSYEPIPQYAINRAGSGFPTFWSAVKARLDAGKPGPVTKRMTYQNYLLASDQTILKQYSSEIERFNALKLLPPVKSNIVDMYYADKAQFIGYTPKDAGDWQRNLMYFNAALGMELQGDLHLVIVQNETISANPDAYLLALKAYWHNKDVFGDDAISKNSIIVVVGTKNGDSVAWVRAVTGMPLGNEQMIVAIRNFPWENVPLTPDAVIGTVNGEFYTAAQDDGSKKIKIRGVHNGGALERIIWGLDKPQTKFNRVSMKDFNYLSGEIEPTGKQKFWILFVTFLVCLPVWLVFIAVGERTWRKTP
ncbi:MAG: hypothetical protein HYV47_00130 [Candidatus Nealsonbacteria bacterium]|nr:hypothetical protein [Candidatus Nealsonbacteria bacterium]